LQYFLLVPDLEAWAMWHCVPYLKFICQYVLLYNLSGPNGPFIVSAKERKSIYNVIMAGAWKWVRGSEFGFSGLGCARASLLTARRLTQSKLELRLKMLGVNARVHNYTSNKPLHSINYVELVVQRHTLNFICYSSCFSLRC
jgi:hypothetical protein